jgi:hypothetical protein
MMYSHNSGRKLEASSIYAASIAEKYCDISLNTRAFMVKITHHIREKVIHNTSFLLSFSPDAFERI